MGKKIKIPVLQQRNLFFKSKFKFLDRQKNDLFFVHSQANYFMEKDYEQTKIGEGDTDRKILFSSSILI